jgi:hypothetical protein
VLSERLIWLDQPDALFAPRGNDGLPKLPKEEGVRFVAPPLGLFGQVSEAEWVRFF